MFKATKQIDLPTKDILSYIFDKPAYDQDKPVCSSSAELNTARLIVCVEDICRRQ